MIPLKKVFFLIVLLIPACNPSPNQITDQENNLHHYDLDAFKINLIQGGDFEYPTDDIFLHWKLDEIYKYSKMFEVDESWGVGGKSLKSTRNSKGQHMIFQDVKVEQGAYQFQMVYQLENKNGKRAGAYISCAGSDELIASGEMVFSTSFPTILEFPVQVDTCDTVRISLGFKDGQKADLHIDKVQFYKSNPANNYQMSYINSFSKLLDARRSKDFQPYTNIADVDVAISVSSELMKILLSDKGERKPINDEYAGKFPGYFSHYIDMDEKKVRSSLCQRISLSAAETLGLYYGIKSRQIHAKYEGTGIHQFLEIYSEDEKKWIIIDPFYGLLYKKDGVYLGLEELKATEGKFETVLQPGFKNFYYSEKEVKRVLDETLLRNGYYSPAISEL